MRYIIICFLLIGLTCAVSFAQPEVAWLHLYDNGEEEGFHDIYAASDDTYIMCGTSGRHWMTLYGVIYVVRIENDGEIIWAQTYEFGRGQALSIIEADNGDFVIGGKSGIQFHAMRIDNEGELIWRRDYGRGTCHAVIELKGGEFLLAGRSRHDDGRDGMLVMINGAGNVIWQRTHRMEGNSCFYTMRETDGGVVVAGYGQIDIRNHVWVIKVELEDGDVVWSRFHGDIDMGGALGMVSSGDAGFALTGNGNGDLQDFYLLKINENGLRQWVQIYEDETMDYAYGIDRLDDGGYILVGLTHSGYIRPKVVRTNSEGTIRWQVEYNMEADERFMSGSNWFNSVIIGHDNSIIAAGAVNVIHEDDEVSYDGLVMKLEPEILEPQFITYSPEDTVFTVLQSDTDTFWVYAHDAQGDDLSYLWIVGEDTISRDTTITYCFEELGEYIVTCQVSDGEFVAEIHWRITAVEFYIADFRPDSTEMTIRRRSEIDFAIDVRALDLEGLGYYWDLVDRNGVRQEIGDGDSVRVPFDLTGDYDVEGVVWRGDNFDMAHWAVTVRSAVWSWFPEDSALTVPFDTTMVFEVIPFNPASDSIGYHWTLNDDLLDVDTTVSVATIEFPFINQEIVRCLVCDGCEIDSVTWLIDVVDPYDVALDPDDLLPASVSLSTPFPNPFNAITRIAYAVPSAGQVKLAVYDISGRMLGMLVDGNVSAGRHVCEFDGGDLSAGLYFVRLEAGGVVVARKGVLVK